MKASSIFAGIIPAILTALGWAAAERNVFAGDSMDQSDLVIGATAEQKRRFSTQVLRLKAPPPAQAPDLHQQVTHAVSDPHVLGQTSLPESKTAKKPPGTSPTSSTTNGEITPGGGKSGRTIYYPHPIRGN